MEFPDGLVLYKNFIPTSYTDKLYKYIDKLNYHSLENITRKIQHYGYIYDYRLREPLTKKLEKTHDVPPALNCICKLLYKYKIMDCMPNQVIINKYEPGEGIAPHRDHYPIFGNSIATLSLGSEYVMTFRHHKSHPKYDPNIKLDISLPIGSLLVFSDEARLYWTHEISKRKTDNKKKRSTRISVTFRTVQKEYL
jgi:alkylated DNA repair dioxygenase AlkB